MYVQGDQICTGRLVSLMNVAWGSIWITNISLMIIVINERYVLNDSESKSYHLQPKFSKYLLKKLMSESIEYMVCAEQQNQK